jgi:hypothetical protein
MPLPYPTLVPPRQQNLARRRDGGARGWQPEESNNEHGEYGGEYREDRDGQVDGGGGWQGVEERQRRHAGELESSVLDRIDRRAASQVAKLRRGGR